MDKIQYISPSSFYYWEKCPLMAVLSKLPDSEWFSSKHPDVDLGTIIHRFYEKQNEWQIDSYEKFNIKWHAEINELNKCYKENDLQNIFFPIQWHANYYAVKKILLSNKLLSKIVYSKENESGVQYIYEQWVNNDFIGGKIDLLVKEDGIVRQIIDFKTGKIFEKEDKTIRLKEVYKQQLGLYLAVVLENQEFIPDVFIEKMDGDRVKVEIEMPYIEALRVKAKLLKDIINSALHNNLTEALGNCNSENCGYCFHRHKCNVYKKTLMNRKIGSRIDLYGKIIEVKPNEIIIETNLEKFEIMKIKNVDGYILNNQCEIYNLYYPENDNNVLFETLNTVVKYVE